jgi:hypothetical protein
MSLIRYLQDCVGLQLHRVLFFDEPKFIRYLWYLIKPILVDSMKMKIDFHGSSYERLAEVVPAYNRTANLDELCGAYDWVAQQVINENENINSKQPARSVCSEAETVGDREAGSFPSCADADREEAVVSAEARVSDETIVQHLIRLSSSKSYASDDPCVEGMLQEIVSDFAASCELNPHDSDSSIS